MRIATVSALLALGLVTQAAEVPRPAREFTIVQPSGTQTLLSSYKGKVVMFACIFTTCPHCQSLSQMMTALQRDLGARGFQAVAVAFNDEVNTPNKAANASVTSNFTQQFQVGFPVGYAPRDTVMSYLGLSVIDQRWVVPQIMIIDRKGVIRAQSDPKGTEQLQNAAYLRKYLDELLNEGAAPAKSNAKKTVPKKTS